MKKDGLLINYEFCSGCRACEAACKQEHDFPKGIQGIKVVELILNQGQTYNYIPVPTDLCNLCDSLVARGGQPACVHHCMAQVMKYGPLDKLAAEMAAERGSVLWAPQPKPAQNPVTGESLIGRKTESK